MGMAADVRPGWLRLDRAPRRLPAWPLLVVAAGVGLLLAYLFVPHVTVVLRPPTQAIEETIELRADPAAPAVDVRGRRVPARVGYVVEDVAERQTVEGRRPDPAARAIGTITLTNRKGSATAVPAGTLVMTASGVRFATTVDASIEGTPGAVARVPVQAMLPGTPGNVGRLEISRLIGPLASQLAVLNEEPTVGGGQSETAVVGDEDVARVRRAAAERARSDALHDLGADLTADELLLAGSLQSAMVEESLDRPVGDRAPMLGYRLRARFSATRIGLDDVRQLVRELWKPSAPAGYFVPEQQLEVGVPEVARVEAGVVVLRVVARTVAVARIDPDLVREKVRWRDPDEARRDLARTLTLAAAPRVAVEPRWMGRALRVGVVFDLNPPAEPHG